MKRFCYIVKYWLLAADLMFLSWKHFRIVYEGKFSSSNPLCPALYILNYDITNLGWKLEVSCVSKTPQIRADRSKETFFVSLTTILSYLQPSDLSKVMFWKKRRKQIMTNTHQKKNFWTETFCLWHLLDTHIPNASPLRNVSGFHGAT